VIHLDQRSQDLLQLWRQQGLGHQWCTSDIQATSVFGCSSGEAWRASVLEPREDEKKVIEKVLL